MAWRDQDDVGAGRKERGSNSCNPEGYRCKRIFQAHPGPTQVAEKLAEYSQVRHKYTQEKPETCAKDQVGIQVYQLRVQSGDQKPF